MSTLWSSIHCTDRTLRPLKVEALTQPHRPLRTPRLSRCCLQVYRRAVEGKRLELSTPNLVHIHTMAVAGHALIRRSKGERSRSHSYENHHGRMAASKVCCCCRRRTALRMTASQASNRSVVRCIDEMWLVISVPLSGWGSEWRAWVSRLAVVGKSYHSHRSHSLSLARRIRPHCTPVQDVLSHRGHPLRHHSTRVHTGTHPTVSISQLEMRGKD